MPLTQQAVQLLQLSTGGSYSLARDALKHRVWDTRYFASTVSDWTFFAQQIGQPWRTGLKTLTETNMYDSGKLPNGQVMVFTHMAVRFLPEPLLTVTTGEDLIQSYFNVMQSSVFEVKIQGREWDAQIHGSEFVPPFAISATASAANNHRVGDSIASGVSKLLPTPIVLDQMVTFSVVHRLGNPDTTVLASVNAACAALNTGGALVQVSLEGLLTRAK